MGRELTENILFRVHVGSCYSTFRMHRSRARTDFRRARCAAAGRSSYSTGALDDVEKSACFAIPTRTELEVFAHAFLVTLPKWRCCHRCRGRRARPLCVCVSVSVYVQETACVSTLARSKGVKLATGAARHLLHVLLGRKACLGCCPCQSRRHTIVAFTCMGGSICRCRARDHHGSGG